MGGRSKIFYSLFIFGIDRNNGQRDLSDYQKARFYTFFKNAEGLGKRWSTHLLRKCQLYMAVRPSWRCVVSQLESAVGIHFRRGKVEVSRLLAYETSHPEETGAAKLTLRSKVLDHEFYTSVNSSKA